MRRRRRLYQENISVLLSTTFWLQTCGVFLMLGYIFWTGFSKGYFFTIMYNVLYVGICKCIIVKSVNKSYSIAVGILYVCYISIRYTQSEIMYSTLYSYVHNIYEGQNYFNIVKTKSMYQTSVGLAVRPLTGLAVRPLIGLNIPPPSPSTPLSFYPSHWILFG